MPKTPATTHRHIKAALILVATLTLLAGSASAEPGQAARHLSFMKAATTFLKGATPGARAIFAKRGSRDGSIALGAVLQLTHVSRDLRIHGLLTHKLSSRLRHHAGNLAALVHYQSADETAKSKQRGVAA